MMKKRSRKIWSLSYGEIETENKPTQISYKNYNLLILNVLLAEKHLALRWRQ